MQLKKLKEFSSSIRKKILEMSFDCGGTSHIGGGLSSVEILPLVRISHLNPPL